MHVDRGVAADSGSQHANHSHECQIPIRIPGCVKKSPWSDTVRPIASFILLHDLQRQQIELALQIGEQQLRPGTAD